MKNVDFHTDPRLFEHAVESAPNAMIMVDAEGIIILINKQTENLFGYTRNELISERVDKLVPVQFRDKHPQHRDNFLHNPATRSMGAGRDLYGLRKDGTEVPIEIGLSPVKTEDGFFVLASIVDITERKKAEEEIIRSNQELEQFAYVASHDLLEPVRKIVGFTQLFAKSFDAPIEGKSEEYMDYVIDGAKRMQVLIEDLLQYSRAGTTELDFQDVDLNVVLQEVEENLELSIKETNAEIRYNKLPVIKAHKSFMVRLFQNLINNSLKYRSDAAPHIEIYANQKTREWEFVVADNGLGIDPEHAQRIFIIFQRLHGKSEYSGTGIGLAVCRRMVERHNGKMWLDTSSDRHGSTFKFTIPFEIV